MNSYCIMVLCSLILLLSSSHVSLAGRAIPSSAPSTVVRPLMATAESDVQDYESLKPRLDGQKSHQSKLGGGREFKGCLPKGFRRASAPSRFVNFQTLGSAACNKSNGVGPKKP